MSDRIRKYPPQTKTNLFAPSESMEGLSVFIEGITRVMEATGVKPDGELIPSQRFALHHPKALNCAVKDKEQT